MRAFVSFLLLAFHSVTIAKDISREIDFSCLRAFEYVGSGRVEIQQGKENRLVLRGNEGVIKKFSITFTDGMLSIQPRNLADFRAASHTPHVTLIVNHLEKLFLQGDSYVDIDMLKTDHLMIELRKGGSTLLEGRIDCKRMALSIVGNSQAQIHGRAYFQSVYINGSGFYDGKDFVTDNANTCLIGASSALVNVKKNLSISIQDFGHVHYVPYKDHPLQLEKRVEGKGVVSPLTQEIVKQFEEKSNEKSRSTCST